MHSVVILNIKTNHLGMSNEVVKGTLYAQSSAVKYSISSYVHVFFYWFIDSGDEGKVALLTWIKDAVYIVEEEESACKGFSWCS